jgi:carboxyl-terminal processing protease
VQVVIAREGADKPVIFNIIRDEIPRKSVEDAFWVKPGIMYLDIQSFNENTSREVEENFRRLGEQNVKGSILDLRENPGGLLNEGVAVADRFLQKGQTIVSHRGRSSPEKPYVARHGSGGYDYPIVVLVNRYSASAAEIVAGALQDHDRALILGDQTFGKGLVQTVYPLAENTGLALTTAHFYTPSGRLIQRDYSHTSFYNYYYNRKDGRREERQRREDDRQRPYGVRRRRHHPGREVHRAEVQQVPDRSAPEVCLLLLHCQVLRRRRKRNCPKGWAPDAALMNDFHQYLLKEGVQFTEGEYAENQQWVKEQLRREMYITAFGVEDARKLGIETDPIVLKAVDSLAEGEVPPGERPQADRSADAAAESPAVRIETRAGFSPGPCHK